ncbi:M15 family metallopeptidase [Methylobacterium radiodurans]|nr:M15 family metallopeptidase [Methylobacterium radiodurans]
MRKLASTENATGNPRLKAATSSAVGIFQIVGPTWNDLAARYPQLGLTDPRDAIQQARVAPFYMREISENLQRKLGRKPNAAEMKLGWVFGPTGGSLLMGADPDTPVERVLDRKAIDSNPGIFKNVRTVGQLYNWAGEKMGEQGAHPKPAVDLSPYLAQGKDRDHLDRMDWDLKSRLANMVADMPENIRAKFQINSGYRSPERQAELFAEAVKKYGSEEAARKWVAPPGNSQHNHGKAADINMGGDPAVKAWIHANAAKYGLGFPMAHEPWHIEALDARSTRNARMGLQVDPASTAMRVPFTFEDQRKAAEQREREAYSLVQAARESASQDWMVSNMLKSNGKTVYDPGYSVTQETLQRDDVKGLPPSYLPYLSKSMSEQDFNFRLAQAQKDFEVERRLAATPYGTAIRMAVGMYGENGRKVRILGLEQWEPQVRSAFEHAISTWTRRAVQQNDLGQMNAVLGHPVAKVVTQFRNFVLGAWSKQTLSALHTHELNDLYGFMASMMFGAMAYTVQTNLSLIGLSEEDRAKAASDRLSDRKIAQAGFQRAGASSLIPGAFDLGAELFGFDPLFNTRSTQQPTAGLMSNPTVGLLDGLYTGVKGFTGSLHEDGHVTSGDVRNLSKALNVLHNYPGMLQLINTASSRYPSQ